MDISRILGCSVFVTLLQEAQEDSAHTLTPLAVASLVALRGWMLFNVKPNLVSSGRNGTTRYQYDDFTWVVWMI